MFIQLNDQSFYIMRKSHWVYCLLIVAVLGCKKNEAASPTDTAGKAFFAKGADVSWLTQMEAAGYKFYNASGAAMECMQLMQSLGMNSIRLRVWVNPANGWCNNADVVTKALRAKKLGLRILLDFHYSDNWADPGKQNKPAAWAGYDFTTLKNTIYSYTYNVLDTLRSSGVAPTWVQIGNETNDGMLWSDGKASVNMGNFASLISSGYKAVKAINDSIKVIVHISNGYDNNLFRWIFDGLRNNGAGWDIIGMSMYPTASNWQSRNTSCLANMKDLIARYNTPVMICEVGMPYTDASACQSFITDLIDKTRSLPDNNGLGVFYWEPQCYNNWEGYTLGAFDNNGRPTVAMKAFADQ
jgi:arabinogalactan endo-1,4-beta-galactosidase